MITQMEESGIEIDAGLRRVLKAAILLNDQYHDKESRLVSRGDPSKPIKHAILEMRSACDALAPTTRKAIAGKLVR